MSSATSVRVVWLTVALLATLPVACSDQAGRDTQAGVEPAAALSPDAAGRWYASADVERGASVFAEHCALCHGSSAQGLAEDWKARLPDGSYPPPPLNGTAHAWHHPLVQLVQTIETGGIPYGGKMPPFGEVLSDEQKLAAIAFFQSFWEEDIYQAWLDRGGLD